MQQLRSFPVIDPVATGQNILRLRRERGLSVRDLQAWFGFEEPRAIYKWQSGRSLPSLDNLYALSALLGVPMEAILIPVRCSVSCNESQAEACGSHHIRAFSPGWNQRFLFPARRVRYYRYQPNGHTIDRRRRA